MGEIVNFEIAKLLKEKGFKEPVIKCYATFKENIVLHSIYNSEIPEDMNGTRHEIIPNVYPNPPYYSAPTIAEVVMWLYEKHGLWVNVVYMGFELKYTWSIDIITTSGSNWDSYGEEDDICYNLPKEAYEAAIEYALKNLI